MPGRDDYPPMPASEAEWRAHWAIYKLTVAQRNSAWREIELLRLLNLVRDAQGRGE